MLTIASASGNRFAYAWTDEVPDSFDGPRWAQILCAAPRLGWALDGLFLLQRPEAGKPWRMDHWDPDGSLSFCGNGSRAALAIPGAPTEMLIEAFSSGEAIRLRRDVDGYAIRMPEGSGFGFESSPLPLDLPHVCAWIGNPQLIIEVPNTEEVDLPVFAPPLRHHKAFPQGTNVCVLEIRSRGEARIRSWERGVEGETLSCGTGTAVSGAWLAKRTGIPNWRIQTLSQETLTVSAEILANGNWHELWLSGAVSVLGVYTPEDGMLHARRES